MYIKRLEDLRVDRDLNQKDLANYLCVADNTYGQWENDKRHIPIEAIINLSKFYNTSVDYILGLTDVMKPYPRKM